jgi:multidrug efflux system membrane fusion protein
MSCSKKAPTHAPLPHNVIVADVKTQSLPKYLLYVGHVEATATVNIIPQVQGILTGSFFKEGDFVDEGSLLFTIDDRPFQAALTQAEALLVESQANLTVAEDTVKRYSSLVQKDYVAQLTFNQYLANMMGSKAIVEQQKAAVETSKINLSYCKIASPIKGVAGALQVDVGNLVNTTTPSLVRINQVQPINITFYAPQQDFVKIMPLQQAAKLTVEVENPLKPNTYLPAELTFIDNLVNQSTGSIFMRASLGNDPIQLWPGEYVRIRVKLGNTPQAVVVPQEAVQIGQDGPYVYVINGQKADLKLVKLGESFNRTQVIEEGLTQGETVVVEGQINLSPGSVINIIKKV